MCFRLFSRLPSNYQSAGRRSDNESMFIVVRIPVLAFVNELVQYTASTLFLAGRCRISLGVARWKVGVPEILRIRHGSAGEPETN